MDLTEKLGNGFVITTEPGPAKGALSADSLEKAGGGVQGTNKIIEFTHSLGR